MSHLITLTTLLPGLGALLGALTYLVPSRNPRIRESLNPTQVLTTACITVAALLAWVMFLSPPETATQSWFTWLTLPNGAHISLGTLTDRLSTTMLMVVSTVSACVHWYSIGYMKNDPSKRRFFIYLSLFTLAMNLLVTAPNLLQMFLGWEGVGLCSYLLIGFWHHKPSANAAALKAFIVNRVADAALLLGLFLTLQTFQTLDYQEIFTQLATATPNTLTPYHPNILSLISLLLFIGAMGKSAQIGFHTWLPDAMEGPTPVSALIHAATMVTAGVFLLCRLSPLYEVTPDVLHLVGWVGALTALFAATIGLTQTDIKRVIAYSTCSQLGYMFFAIGVSAYPAAMFHLTTHAFFKALMFLGAGGVITAAHHEQNLFKLGGFKHTLPITYGLMWAGSLALCGIPPFAGFFSKDLILESAFMAPTASGIALFAMGTLAALLTAAYTFRLLFLTFEGTPTNHESRVTSHESRLLWLPLLPLALGALLSGILLHAMGTLEWWHGALAIAPANTALQSAHHTPILIKILPVLAAATGIYLAWRWFGQPSWGLSSRKLDGCEVGVGAPTSRAPSAVRDKRSSGTPVKESPYQSPITNNQSPFGLFHTLSLHKYYVDEAYHALFVRPTHQLAKFSATVLDKRLLDGLVNGAARTVWEFGQSLRPLQTGNLAHYGLAMLLGLVLAFSYLLWITGS